MLSKITIVTYAHLLHRHWIPFWVEQLNQQTLEDFNIVFIAHNWKLEECDFNEFKKLNNYKKFVAYEYESEPVIGAVIDHACRLVETEYMAHWDIDDPMHPDRLQLQQDFLEDNPDVDFLNARSMGFYGDNPEWPDLLYHPFEDEPIVSELMNPDLQTSGQIKTMFNRGYNCLSHGLMVYRPEIILKLGGFSRSDVKLDGKSPDFETWKKAINAGYKFHRLPELLMMWRLDSSSIRHI